MGQEHMTFGDIHRHLGLIRYDWAIALEATDKPFQTGWLAAA